MSYAEVFLLVWALLATTFAVIFFHTTKSAVSRIAMLIEGINLIESGEMRIVRDSRGNLKAERVIKDEQA
jgi:hypothetical protein